MSTTTIRLPKDLKSRVATAAERAGTTTHEFILAAIAEKTNREANGVGFLDTAEKRYAGIAVSSRTIPWSEMRVYLESRASGNPAPRPAARKLAR